MDTPRMDTRFEDSDFADAEWLAPGQSVDGGRTAKYLGWTVFLAVLAIFIA